jgi:hypothetical protein
VSSRTISVRDMDTRPVGKPNTIDFHKFNIFNLSFPVEADDQGKVKIPELLDDLADGVVAFTWNDEHIDRHVETVKRYVEERTAKAAARAADYAKRAGP